MLPDLVRCYGACGRSIIFTETKRDANELTNLLSEGSGARALHGDIPQVIFFSARGLIVWTEPDTEIYISVFRISKNVVIYGILMNRFKCRCEIRLISTT